MSVVITPPKLDAGSERPASLRQHTREIAEKLRQTTVELNAALALIETLASATLYMLSDYVETDYVY